MEGAHLLAWVQRTPATASRVGRRGGEGLVRVGGEVRRFYVQGEGWFPARQGIARQEVSLGEKRRAFQVSFSQIFYRRKS